MKLNNQSEQGTHPKQERDPETFDASRPNATANEFFPQPDSLGVQENRTHGGVAVQGRAHGQGQFHHGKKQVLPEPLGENPPDDITPPTAEVCPQGQEMWNGHCVDRCPSGYERQTDGRCQPPPLVDPGCPAGQEKWNGQCVAKCAAGELRDLKTGQCKPDCNAANGLENAKPGTAVPPGYGPLIEKRSKPGVNFTATAAYIEHSADWNAGSGEIKITVSAAATPVHVRYFAWGVWDNWMDIADGAKARNPVPVDKISLIEGQKFNWHDAWKNNQIQVAVIYNETGALAWKWPSQATRAAAVTPVDALFLPHNHDYKPPSGSVQNEMWNGQCVPKCGVNEHRNATTGQCEQCPTGKTWNGSECVGSVAPPPFSGGVIPCLSGMERVNGQCVTKCSATQYRNPAGQCVARPAVTLSGAWGNNTTWTFNDRNNAGERFHKIEPLANDFSVKSNYTAIYGPPHKILRAMNWQNMNACRADKTGHAAHYPYGDPLNLHTRGFTGSAGGGTFAAGVHPLHFIETCNAMGVIPWVHVPWPTAAVNDRGWLAEFAGWCAQATAPNVIVEVGNEPWNMGWPFMGGNLGVGKWAIAQGYSGVRLSPDGRQAWGDVEKGALGLTKIVDEVLRPTLGNKLITVVNFQSVESKSTQYKAWTEEVGYAPDAFAIANYLRGVVNQPMSLARGREVMGTEVARMTAARDNAHAIGKMACNYEFGIEQYNAIDYGSNRAGWEATSRALIAMIQSETCATLIREIGGHAQQILDFGCMYTQLGFDEFGMMQDLDHPTPPHFAWKGMQS